MLLKFSTNRTMDNAGYIFIVLDLLKIKRFSPLVSGGKKINLMCNVTYFIIKPQTNILYAYGIDKKNAGFSSYVECLKPCL